MEYSSNIYKVKSIYDHYTRYLASAYNQYVSVTLSDLSP
jgi:hypothetical protein